MTHQQMTHDQATKLAALVNALRPDWDTPGVMDALAAARTKAAPADLAVAAVKAAAAATNRTPAVIPLDGDHWREHARTIRPPLIPGRCDVCHQLHGTAPCPQHHHTDYAAMALDHMAGLRGTLAHVKAGLCPHGVKWVDCRQHDTDVVVGEVTETEEEETADA